MSPQYSTDDKVTEMAEKARSTAEEFLRQAKEKKDEISDAAKETLESSKEAVLGENEHEEKEKFKEKIEKGDYDRLGRP
jgi:vacuolar-type H+-ATPase subunit H